MSTADDISNSLSSGIPPAAPDGMAAILGRMCDGFLALDTDGRIIYVNEPAAQVFGRCREALAGRLLWEEFPEGVGTEFHEACCEAARTQTPLQFEAFSSAPGRWLRWQVYSNARKAHTVHGWDISAPSFL